MTIFLSVRHIVLACKTDNTKLPSRVAFDNKTSGNNSRHGTDPVYNIFKHNWLLR